MPLRTGKLLPVNEPSDSTLNLAQYVGTDIQRQNLATYTRDDASDLGLLGKEVVSFDDIEFLLNVRAHQSVRPNCWYPLSDASNSINGSLTLNQLRLLPVVLPAMPIVQLAVGVTVAGAAGSALRLGLYSDRTGYGSDPDQLVYDFGQIATNTTTPAQLVGNWSLDGGQYWVGAVQQGAFATVVTVNTNSASLLMPVTFDATLPVNTISPQSCVAMSGVTAELPQTFVQDAVVGSVPRILALTAAA